MYMTSAHRVSIQTADFDVGAELAALRAGDHRVGAVCSFVGTVRAHNAKPTQAEQAEQATPSDLAAPIVSMELEHYPGMTERAIEAMIDAAHGARWVDARVADDAAMARWGVDSSNAAPTQHL